MWIWIFLGILIVALGGLVYWLTLSPEEPKKQPMCTIDGQDIYQKTIYGLDGTLMTHHKAPCSNCAQYVYKDPQNKCVTLEPKDGICFVGNSVAKKCPE